MLFHVFFHQTNQLLLVMGQFTLPGWYRNDYPASATASKVDRQPCSLVQGGTNVKMAIEFATVNLSIFDRKGIFNVHIESSSFAICIHS